MYAIILTVLGQNLLQLTQNVQNSYIEFLSVFVPFLAKKKDM